MTEESAYTERGEPGKFEPTASNCCDKTDHRPSKKRSGVSDLTSKLRFHLK
jgi:hypothetical protein